MIIRGEGMPSKNESVGQGDLIINFDIMFPINLEADRAKYLVKILPQPKKQIWDLQYEKLPDSEIINVKMEKLNNDNNNNNTTNNTTNSEPFNYNNYKFPEGVKLDEGDEVPIQCATQ